MSQQPSTPTSADVKRTRNSRDGATSCGFCRHRPKLECKGRQELVPELQAERDAAQAAAAAATASADALLAQLGELGMRQRGLLMGTCPRPCRAC